MQRVSERTGDGVEMRCTTKLTTTRSSAGNWVRYIQYLRPVFVRLMF